MIEVVFGGDGLDSMVTVVGKCKSEWGSFALGARWESYEWILVEKFLLLH